MTWVEGLIWLVYITIAVAVGVYLQNKLEGHRNLSAYQVQIRAGIMGGMWPIVMIIIAVYLLLTVVSDVLSGRLS